MIRFPIISELGILNLPENKYLFLWGKNKAEFKHFNLPWAYKEREKEANDKACIEHCHTDSSSLQAQTDFFFIWQNLQVLYMPMFLAMQNIFLNKMLAINMTTYMFFRWGSTLVVI